MRFTISCQRADTEICRHFVDKLKAQGYEEVKLIRTDDGKFMTKKEAKRLRLTGSTLLVGKK